MYPVIKEGALSPATNSIATLNTNFKILPQEKLLIFAPSFQYLPFNILHLVTNGMCFQSYNKKLSAFLNHNFLFLMYVRSITYR
jgi:hypothetical protein